MTRRQSNLPDLFDSWEESPAPVHVTRKRLGGVKLLALATLLVFGVVASSVATLVALTLGGLQSSLETVELPDAPVPVLPSIGEIEGGFNVLVVGSDTREGQGEGFDFVDTQLNDVNLLVHVSQNHDRAVVVSFPRDLLLDVPSCLRIDGTESAARQMVPLNSTLSRGGLPCVVSTLSQATGLDIEYAALVTFAGVAQLSTALGGVEICVDAPLVDPWSGIDLSEAGVHSLQGYEALAFLRTRKAVGDGSDLSRISSQQVFLSALVRSLQADGVLDDVTKLYGLARTAADTMTFSTSLGNLDVMVTMARALRGIPSEAIVFIRYPVLDADPARYPGRVVAHPELAKEVSERLQDGEAFTVSPGSQGAGSKSAGLGRTLSESEGSAEVLEGLVGQTAAEETCTVPR